MEKITAIVETIEALEVTEGGVDVLSSLQAGETWY